MDLFTYLLGKKGQNTHRDLFSYLLGKGAGGSGTYVNFTGASLNISNTLRARIKNITLKGATSQDGTPTPDTPIPIKVVTGEQNVKISGKNLFDKDKISIGYLKEDSTLSTDTAYRTSDFISIRPNTTYYKTSTESPRTKYFDINKIPLNTTTYWDIPTGGSAGTFTTPNNAYYLRLSYPAVGSSAIDEDTIMIKEGTATTYTPYYSKDYPLSLGNMELCSSPDKTLKDYIYGTPNNWYKYKYIYKVVFDGTEDWSKLVEYTNTIQFLTQVVPSKKVGLYNVISDLFKTYTGNAEEECILGQSANTGLQIIINKTRATTVEEFKTWLSTHNVTAYYELNTPTEEQITDTTLITQLNNLYNATSQEGTTYITCSSTSDSNEIIVFSGDIKVTSVGNSLNTSLLSSNIQEEPNLDDVNETEDIEQNEEPIEEEVS